MSPTKRGKYAEHEALDPFFEVIQEGLEGLVQGGHFFDTIAEDALFEFLYDFPGWPRIIRGRADLVDKFAHYGDNISLHASGELVVHRSVDPRVVILEYEVHGKIVSTGTPYDNRFISVITIENEKIVRWRDYMDSLAAWMALSGDRP
jgi:ketosteroid isomerase-like protein